MKPEWSHVIRLEEVPRDGRTVKLDADEAARKRIARRLDLANLNAFSARLGLSPWFDGVEISGDWRAAVTQNCGITLERIDSDLSGRFVARVVPEGSPQAPADDQLGDLDPDADDPPDVAENGEVDLAELLIEYLSLEIDPYPRKEGAVFEQPEGQDELSPFAVLKTLKRD